VLEAEVVSTLPRACFHCGSVSAVAGAGAGSGACGWRVRWSWSPITIVTSGRDLGSGRPGEAPRAVGPETGDGSVP